MGPSADGYHHHHRHTGIGLRTPADVHYGLAPGTLTARPPLLRPVQARFTTSRSPKIINLPEAAWINQPTQDAASDPLFDAVVDTDPGADLARSRPFRVEDRVPGGVAVASLDLPRLPEGAFVGGS